MAGLAAIILAFICAAVCYTKGYKHDHENQPFLSNLALNSELAYL